MDAGVNYIYCRYMSVYATFVFGSETFLTVTHVCVLVVCYQNTSLC